LPNQIRPVTYQASAISLKKATNFSTVLALLSPPSSLLLDEKYNLPRLPSFEIQILFLQIT